MSDYTDAWWALALANFTGTYASVHKTDSSRTELSGSGYARQAVTFGTAASGARANTVAVSVPTSSATPSSTEVGWVGLYSASTSGTLYAMFPMGLISEFEATTDASTDLVSTGEVHNFSEGDRVTFDSIDGTLPTNVTVGVSYYVLGAAKGLTTTAFKIATTADGTIINLTSTTGTGILVRKFTPITTGPSALVDFGVGAIIVSK